MTVISTTDYLHYVNNCGKICNFVNNGQTFSDMATNLTECSPGYCKSKKLPSALCTVMSQMVTQNNANEIIYFCEQNQKYNFFDFKLSLLDQKIIIIIK